MYIGALNAEATDHRRPALRDARMNDPRLRRATLALIIAVLLVGGTAASLVATGPARAAASVTVASTGALEVTADPSYTFTPNAFSQLPLNATITVTFTDADTIGHTFSILKRQGVVIPASTSSGDLTQLFTTYGAIFTSSLNGSGDQFKGTFTSPAAAGWYEFVCQEPGHFQNGMYGFLAFGMNLPGNLTVSAANTDPGAPVFIIVGTIVSLTVIALVLGFVIGRRRGATYEMPPERLGYPEPEAPPSSATNPPAPPPPKG
jgi:plastocyanin